MDDRDEGLEGISGAESALEEAVACDIDDDNEELSAPNPTPDEIIDGGFGAEEIRLRLADASELFPRSHGFGGDGGIL